MSIVTLVSGGIDSTVMARIIEEEGEEQIPLFIDYGQLAKNREWEACQKLQRNLNLPEPVKVDISGYGELLPSGITDNNKNINKDAFLPGRNLLFILIGSSYAHHLGIGKIAFGLLSEESHLFPDQTGKFIVNANVAVNIALDDDIVVLTPLINFVKADVIRLAKHYKIPLDETYSCHSGNKSYCGECVACREILMSGEKESINQFRKGGD